MAGGGRAEGRGGEDPLGPRVVKRKVFYRTVCVGSNGRPSEAERRAVSPMPCKPPDLNRAVPWVAAIVGVSDKAQLSPNNSPNQSSYPKTQYENPARFGVYGKLPTASYTNVRDVSDYTVMPPLPPQTRHSQYIFELREFLQPYNAAPSMRHSTVYARPVSTPTLTDPPTSPIHGTPAHHGTWRTTQRSDLRHASRLVLVPHPWGTISLRRRTSQRIDLQLPPPEKT